MSLIIVGLDTTIVNIALPSLRNDLDASVSALQCVLDAYTLVLASLLILAGSTADRVGRRRTFRTGLALFTIGSLLCSVAARFVPESRAEHPRRIDPVGSGATLIAVCAFGALGGFLFLNSLYLQESRGLSALEAGSHTLPMALLTAVVAPLSGRIVGARGPRLPLILAGSAIALAMLPLTRLTADTPVWLLFGAYALFGFGFGMVNAPITDTAVSGMPRAQAGVAAAIASISRQVGAALGVAVVGAAVVSGLGRATAASFTQAGRTGWWILFGCGLAVLVLGLATTGARARATAAPVESPVPVS